jgi:hypothetical protein
MIDELQWHAASSVSIVCVYVLVHCYSSCSVKSLYASYVPFEISVKHILTV